jgi:ComF family protein
LCELTCNQDAFICSACQPHLPHYTTGCTSCGASLPTQADSNLCGICIATPPAYDQLYALYNYAEPISSFIHQLKFQNNLRIARWFSHEWISKFNNQIILPDIIFPVPLHHTRLSERGFNQAIEIAKPLAQDFNIPIDIKTCIRIKNTNAQSALNLKKRNNNVKNAFALSKTITANHVALFDDVVTTGNTVSEIAQLLRKVGVRQIDVWCVARAQKK